MYPYRPACLKHDTIRFSDQNDQLLAKGQLPFPICHLLLVLQSGRLWSVIKYCQQKNSAKPTSSRKKEKEP